MTPPCSPDWILQLLAIYPSSKRDLSILLGLLFCFWFTEKPVYPFLKPGWVVLICLGGVLAAGLVALMSCHKRTRKQISGICCRKYVALSTDVETLVEGHHEGRYEEQATRTTESE